MISKKLSNNRIKLVVERRMCSFGASYLNTYLANKRDWESESMSLKAIIVPIFFFYFFVSTRIYQKILKSVTTMNSSLRITKTQLISHLVSRASQDSHLPFCHGKAFCAGGYVWVLGI